MPSGRLAGSSALLANADKATQGNSGVGTPSHVAGVFLQNAIGARWQLVPYRSAGLSMQGLVAGNIGAGQENSDEIRITARSNVNQGDQTRIEQRITVRGPDEEQGVRRVTGRVVDDNSNDPVEGALVVMRDSKNQRFNTETDGDGRFQFASSGQRQIAPGRIGIAVTKAVLVILYFMDVRDASRLTRLVVASGFAWFAIMVLFTMADVLTRGGFPSLAATP